MHAAGGVIRREPAGIILCGPAPPGLIVVAELLAFAQEPIVELLRAGATEPRRMDERGKERVRSHEKHYMKQAPYGTWRSPLAAADLARSAISLNYVQVAAGTPYWVESRPADGGRSVIVTIAEDGAVREITPTGFNVRTRVHEYGGMPYAIGNGIVFFSNFSDQRLYVQRPGAAPVAITPEGYRYADFVLDGSGERLFCVREDHTGAGEPKNAIVMVDIRAGGPGKVLFDSSDFAAYPRLSPDRKSVV